MRRRRYIRRGVLVDEDEAEISVSGIGSLVGPGGRKSLMVSTGTGGRSSMGSGESKRSTGRSSVGFALAPLDEVESLRVEVVSCRLGVCFLFLGRVGGCKIVQVL